MVKKCIVQYDDLGNPIKIVELKEFTDIKSFKDFEELCDKNHKDFEDRLKEAKEKADAEKAKLLNSIALLQKKAELCFEGIRYLMGLADFADLDGFLKCFEEGDNSDEQKD